LSIVLVEVGIFAGIIIGIVQVCLMIFKKKPKKSDIKSSSDTEDEL